MKLNIEQNYNIKVLGIIQNYNTRVLRNEKGRDLVTEPRERERRRKRENNDETGQPESRDISADEVEAITDDATIIDDEDEIAKNEMLAEWDTHMSDFVPDDMLTVELNPREEIVSKFIRF